jgi:alkyldihydroxyacetonephosphate synthase
MTSRRTRSASGWGYVEDDLSTTEVAELADLVGARFPGRPQPSRPAPPLPLPAPRLRPPSALGACCTADDATRRLHGLGRSYLDSLAAHQGRVESAPDVVATPRDAAEVAAVLDWCNQAGAAVVPFGGGTSVVGGVTPPAGDRPVVTVQLRAMGAVLEVDPTARAARVQAGAVGPDLEDQLRPHGLTLRFFPQSFELSTLGGWIATRAGGHFATRLQHIDDLVESVTAVTPAGTWASRRLPGSGAGPSPDRLLLGSEGTLGVITEAWVRLQARPRWRAGASVRFPGSGGFAAGARAARAVVQAGFTPANCRLLDPVEAVLNGAGDGSAAVLVLGWESAHQPIGAEAADTLGLVLDLGGRCPEGIRGRDDEAAGDGPASDAAAAWRRSFLRAPYLRNGLIALGIISETFETAVTWSGLDDLRARVTDAVESALTEVCGDGLVTCRLTHVYPDGAAPYFTVLAPGRPGAEAAQWREVKHAASEALLAAGGTITHHHAVGRDHRPWYDRQRPEPFAVALRAAKAALDPRGMLNPGVLIDPS